MMTSDSGLLFWATLYSQHARSPFSGKLDKPFWVSYTTKCGGNILSRKRVVGNILVGDRCRPICYISSATLPLPSLPPAVPSVRRKSFTNYILQLHLPPLLFATSFFSHSKLKNTVFQSLYASTRPNCFNAT